MFGSEITDQLHRLERQIADMECRALTGETETIDHLQADLELKQLEIDSNVKEMNQIRADRDTFRSEITVLTAQIELLKDKLEDAERQRHSAVENLQPILDRMKQESESFDRERASLEAAVLELRRENESLREENALLKEIRHRLKRAAPQLQQEKVSRRNIRQEASNDAGNEEEVETQQEAENAAVSGIRTVGGSSLFTQTTGMSFSSQFGIVPKKLVNSLASRHQEKLKEEAKAPPPKLSLRLLTTQQNSLNNQTPHVDVPKNIRPVVVPIAPSPWEAFAVLRSALDDEERKFRPFVPSSSKK